MQARFLALLLDLQEKLQFACLFVSHDLAVVDILAHRIAVMHRGRIVEQELGMRSFAIPRTPTLSVLIAAVPLPDPVAQRERRAARIATKD